MVTFLSMERILRFKSKLLIMKNSYTLLKIWHFHVKYDQKFYEFENNNTAIRNLIPSFKATNNEKGKVFA